MSKGKNGNKEAKKPKKAAPTPLTPQAAAASLSTTPAVAPARGKKR